jgi:hypothetical protein
MLESSMGIRLLSPLYQTFEYSHHPHHNVDRHKDLLQLPNHHFGSRLSRIVPSLFPFHMPILRSSQKAATELVVLRLRESCSGLYAAKSVYLREMRSCRLQGMCTKAAPDTSLGSISGRKIVRILCKS